MRTYPHMLHPICRSLLLRNHRLQPLSLQLRRALDDVHRLALQHRDRRIRIDTRARSVHEEHVREAIDGDRHVRLSERRPSVIELGVVSAHDVEGIVVGDVESGG